MRPSLHGWLMVGVMVALAVGVDDVLSQGGVTQEGEYTVFRTGSAEPLLTYELPLDIPEA